jgi:hypothetical protein
MNECTLGSGVSMPSSLRGQTTEVIFGPVGRAFTAFDITRSLNGGLYNSKATPPRLSGHLCERLDLKFGDFGKRARRNRIVKIAVTAPQTVSVNAGAL